MGLHQHRDDHIPIRIPHKPFKIRRRQDRVWRRVSLPCTAIVLFAALSSAFFAFHYLSHDTDVEGRFDRRGMSEEIGVVLAKFNRSVGFGRGFGRGGRDSRYWDMDDRRRDGEYEGDAGDSSGASGVERKKEKKTVEGSTGDVEQGVGGLYNEAGRDELHKYAEKYKDLLEHPEKQAESTKELVDGNSVDDEYDDGFEVEDAFLDGVDGSESGKDNQRLLGEERLKNGESEALLRSGNNTKNGDGESDTGESLLMKTFGAEKKSSAKKKGKRHSGSCEMKLLDSTAQLLEPLQTKKFSRFSLQYTEYEERPLGVSDNWQPRFAGHQTLQEREKSFFARDQKISCGFVKGPKDFPSTGFDLAEDDVKFMSSCHIAVSSCIFGNSDNLRTPYHKTITRSSRKNVCFVMFVDENTLQTLSSEGHQPDAMGFIGLWKIVVVKNLPYDDMRRVGKIPKLLTHRLFPSARYSIWLDSKLRLQRDPLLLLEYFLWRKGNEYAISNHYDRHCVWEEVLQNKKLNKFNHTIIDEQFEFYQADGLKKFDPANPNKLLPSYVPEGSFIMRAHTPMSNLFSCLWFNEVDRFTPRDQLSFAYTFLKLRRMNPEKPFYLNMFKDCERRSIAKLFRHRSENQRTATQAVE